MRSNGVLQLIVNNHSRTLKGEGEGQLLESDMHLGHEGVCVCVCVKVYVVSQLASEAAPPMKHMMRAPALG